MKARSGHGQDGRISRGGRSSEQGGLTDKLSERQRRWGSTMAIVVIFVVLPLLGFYVWFVLKGSSGFVIW